MGVLEIQVFCDIVPCRWVICSGDVNVPYSNWSVYFNYSYITGFCLMNVLYRPIRRFGTFFVAFSNEQV